MSNQSENQLVSSLMGRPEDMHQSLFADSESTKQIIAELSEEQLQQITGGCKDCRIDKGVITKATNRADAYRLSAEDARQRGYHELASFFENDAEQSLKTAEAAQRRIDNRHGPGSTGNEPAHQLALFK
jgi:bacteriocin-like protein